MLKKWKDLEKTQEVAKVVLLRGEEPVSPSASLVKESQGSVVNLTLSRNVSKPPMALEISRMRMLETVKNSRIGGNIPATLANRRRSSRVFEMRRRKIVKPSASNTSS